MSAPLPSLRDAAVLAGTIAAAYIVLIAAARVVRRARGLPFGWTYHVFAVLAGAALALRWTSWDAPLRDAIARHVTAAAIVFAVFPVVTIVNRSIWPQGPKDGQRGAAPRVLADTIGIVVLVVAVLVALQSIYGVQVPGLIAGSGVVAVVLGLAMQDLLGNLMAGIALYFEKSFQTGDWLLVNDTHARVLEISWRSTRLLTMDDVLIDVPNNEIVKQTIMNFELPTRHHAVHVAIGLHYDIPPARAQEVLRKAAASVPGVCAQPAPVIHVKDFADSSVLYDVKVWIDDHARLNRISSDVRSHCWYAVRRAGMEIPYPQLTLHRARPVDGTAAARAAARAALSGHEIFGFLGAGPIESLVANSPVVLFAPGEFLVEQGAAGASMFLLVTGTAEVRIARDGQSTVVATLGPGACLGEMSVLTGDPRAATVVAMEEVEAVEIGKQPFTTLVRDNPDVVARLTELLARRQLANEKLAAGAGHAERTAEARASVLRKLRAFFQLGDRT